MRNTLYLVFSLLLCLAASSCIIAVVEYDPVEGGLPVEEFHESLPLLFGGTLSLDNMYGDIEIRGWESEEVEISAEKLIPRPGEPRVRIFRSDLGLPKIDVDGFEDTVRIKTRFHRGQRRGTVHYFLMVPESVRLNTISAFSGSIFVADLYGEATLELERGSIEVENFSGSLTARVERGDVSATLYDLRPGDRINLISRKGDVILSLSPRANVSVQAEAPNGNISCDFETEKPVPTGEKFEFKLGKEGAVISLSAPNGDIHIQKRIGESGEEKK